MCDSKQKSDEQTDRFAAMTKNATAYYIELEMVKNESGGHYVGLLIFGRHGPEMRLRFRAVSDLKDTGMVTQKEMCAIEEVVEDLKRSGKSRFEGVVTLLQDVYYAVNLAKG